MKTLATSVLVACGNLLLTACALVFGYTRLADLAIAIEMVVLPALLLATAAFVIRDLLRPATRLSAVVAVILSLPGVWLVFSITLR
jgi:hypothetical protein